MLRELSKPRPTCKLLYVTPEQLVQSSSLNNVLGRLHAADLLARLVIDEVWHLCGMCGPCEKRTGFHPGCRHASFPQLTHHCLMPQDSCVSTTMCVCCRRTVSLCGAMTSGLSTRSWGSSG